MRKILAEGDSSSPLPEPGILKKAISFQFMFDYLQADNDALSVIQNPFLVEMRNVTKKFGEKTALENVTWNIPRQQICGLLGPNGAGKTTLFRLLMGILKASEGELRIKDMDSFEDRVPLKRIVGFLPDEPMFYSYLSGREILELSAGMHGLDVPKAMERIAPLIQRLQLTEALDKFADDYSRGMKKKLGLLLAVLHEPMLLILDEPTNGLDVESTRQFFDLMQEASANGTTIVFSTHLMDHVERICSHAAIIHQGRMIIHGTLADLREKFGPERRLEDVFMQIVAAGSPAT
jgi:ABC-2 type transport system ATP-binding protein